MPWNRLSRLARCDALLVFHCDDDHLTRWSSILSSTLPTLTHFSFFSRAATSSIPDTTSALGVAVRSTPEGKSEPHLNKRTHHSCDVRIIPGSPRVTEVFNCQVERTLEQNLRWNDQQRNDWESGDGPIFGTLIYALHSLVVERQTRPVLRRREDS
jgi:hypothetical protein